MKKTLAASMLLMLALSGAAVAHAEDGSSGDNGGDNGGGWFKAFFHMGPPGLLNDRPQGPEGNEGTSSNNGEHRGEGGGEGRFSGRMLPPEMNKNRGIPGTVSAVGTSSFSLDTMKGGATTTLTVNVTDATKYQNGTTTASFASLSVGAHVTVVGSVSTTTSSVAADLVIMNPMPHPGIGMGFGRPEMHDEDGTTTNEQGDDNGNGKGPEHSRGLPGFIAALRDFILSGNASTTISASSSASSSAPIPDERGIFGFLRHLLGF